VRLSTLFVRATIGALFIGHGTQKLFGWFGGHGIEGTGGAFESMGLRPGKRHATAAGAAEAGGGALLALGLLTPVAAASIIATMVTAIRKVHAANGPWVTNGGYEYNLVLIAAAMAIAELGPGPISIDGAFGTERSGLGWGLGALALGAAGAVGAHALAESHPAPPEPPEAAQAPEAAQPPMREQASMPEQAISGQ